MKFYLAFYGYMCKGEFHAFSYIFCVKVWLSHIVLLRLINCRFGIIIEISQVNIGIVLHGCCTRAAILWLALWFCLAEDFFVRVIEKGALCNII